MESLTILNNLRIAAPCSASWDAMRGDERVRFCESCSKQVYNVSGLTAEHAVALIRESEGRLCVRLYRRQDGTVLTADCPVGLRAGLRRRLIRLATAAVVLFAALRSGIWLFAETGSRAQIPPPPTGLGVTCKDLADWAAIAMGIKKPSVSGRTMGRICILPAPNDGGAKADDGGVQNPAQP
jgi:hypothetical protein